jgi:hypothetical protein
MRIKMMFGRGVGSAPDAVSDINTAANNVKT